MKMKIQYAARVMAILFILFTIIFVKPVPARAENTTGYTLADNERVVSSYEELKSALASNNGVTTVYFGADITMTAGILIHASKTYLEISGLDPTDFNQTAPYTLTEYDSNSAGNTISLASNGTLNKLLVKDLKIVGKNYYGSFYIPDNSSNAGLTVVYERVIYNGPQMVYHRYGTSHFIDCDVTIAGTNTTNANQEFGEVGNLIFEGKNTISTSTTSGNGVFYYPYITSSGTGSFEIKDGSSLTLIADNYSSGTDRGLFYTGGSTSTYGIDVTIGTGSELDIKTTASLVGYGTELQSNFKSFTVKQDGTFNLQTTTACATVMYTTGAVTVAEGASFIINSTGNGNSSGLILNQTTGNITVGQGSTFHLVAASTYSRLLQLGSGYKLECNDPASVLLYNPSGRAIQSAGSTCGISIDAQQVNCWTTAGSGSFDDSPLYHWQNASGNVTISASIGTAGATTVNSHTYSGIGTAPNSDSFSMVSARVLSFGRLELIIYELNEESTAIAGTTASGAVVRASFTQDGVDYVLPDTAADGDGFYSISIDTPLTRDTMVIVRSNFQFLNAVSSAVVSPVIKFEMNVPKFLAFDSTEVSSKAQTTRRTDPEWSITVTDTRGTGSVWELYVRATVPLTLQNSPGFILDNALIFVNDTGAAKPLGSTEMLLVYQHTALSDSDITGIPWNPDRGILALIPPGAIYKGNYTGSLEWILTDTP